MREHKADVQNMGVDIVAVIPAGSQHIRDFLHVFGPYPFQIFGDPNRHSYKGLRLKRVSIGKSTKLISNYLFSGRFREIFPKEKEQMKIVRQAMMKQDVYQLGGTWLLDTTGEVLWEHVDSDPSDHASISMVLTKLSECLKLE
ncbi:peroxiredoxin-like family protein [Evansella cellulosilytica]|uniref:peroxiredoxin-like family protein n=1 Tax=Evansella cellulosilytica TaxID=1413 RepID=UPI00247AD8E0|nr:peroxiredoxin-like family protein [Evansella cellulosilytica]